MLCAQGLEDVLQEPPPGPGVQEHRGIVTKPNENLLYNQEQVVSSCLCHELARSSARAFVRLGTS